MAKVVGKDTAMLKRCTCKKCASIIDYEERELTEHSGKDYSGTGYTQYWLKCPECGYDIVVRET